MRIGNDLVDLQSPEAEGKAGDKRFIRRVFTDVEAGWIGSAPQPDQALWAIWSAKEAAFKVARKIVADIPFAHRSFRVSLPDALISGSGSEEVSRAIGRVDVQRVLCGESLSFPVQWQISRQFVHCLASSGICDRSLLRSKVTEETPEDGAPASFAAWCARERASIHSHASAAVRWLAKRVARDAGLGPVEVVREACGGVFGPPALFEPGALRPISGWDLSLSHDGRFVAAALVGPDPASA